MRSSLRLGDRGHWRGWGRQAPADSTPPWWHFPNGVRLVYQRLPDKGPTMQQVKWLMTVCLSPVAAVVFSAAICGLLIVSLTTEMHQRLWQTK
jgi:hypothetical protein